VALQNIIVPGLTLTNFIVFVALVVLTVILGKAAYLITRRLLEPHLPKKNSKLLARVAQYVVLGIGFYSAFSEVLGFDFSAIVVSLGIIGIAVALAAQQIIQNAFAGILISITRPVELEDMVDIGGVPSTGICRVKDISLMNTTLRDKDGRMVFIPNNSIVTNKVVNYTKAGFVAISVPLLVRNVADLPKVQKVVDSAAYDDLKILPHLEGDEKEQTLRTLRKQQIRRILGQEPDMTLFNPRIYVKRVEASRMTLEVEFWIREVELREMVASRFLVEVCSRLNDEGVALADL
jgi:small-conductance mechanosensitive channel